MAWVDLGLVPHVGDQPTAWGREVQATHLHGGRVFLGYGDWNANTGPITIVSWSEGAGFVDEVAFGSEAAHIFRTIGVDLWVPAIDPRGVGDSFAVLEGGVWRLGTFGDAPPVHLFDIVGYGGELFACGASSAAGNPATVWRSSDGGVTWARSLEVAARSGNSRCWCLLVANGLLWTMPTDGDGQFPQSRVWDGVTWEPGVPCLVPDDLGWLSKPWGNGCLTQTWRNRVAFFDGLTVASMGNIVGHAQDYAVVERGLDPPVMVQLAGGHLTLSTDLASWSVVSDAPAGSRSLAVEAVAGGYVAYVGTRDSHLWRSEFTGEPVEIPSTVVVVNDPRHQPAAHRA